MQTSASEDSARGDSCQMLVLAGKMDRRGLVKLCSRFAIQFAGAVLCIVLW